MKEEARKQGGAHCVDTCTLEMHNAMTNAHKVYNERLNEEKKIESEKQAKIKEAKQKRLNEEKRLQEAMTKQQKIDNAQQKLNKQKEETELELQVAQNLKKNAQKQIQIALKSCDMVAIKSCHTLGEQATAELEKVLEKQKILLNNP